MTGDMSTEDRVGRLRALLDGVPPQELRAICVKALRDWRAKYPNRETHGEFKVSSGLVLFAVPLLAERKNTSAAGETLMNVVAPPLLKEPFMRPIVDFVWWLVRAGLAVPVNASPAQVPIAFLMTTAGEWFLAQMTEDDPLLPGFLDRLQKRCYRLPRSIVDLLQDAVKCVDHGLTRPAIVLAGLAFETAALDVVEELVKNTVLPAKDFEKLNAAERIAKLLANVDNLVQGKGPAAKQKREAARGACEFALDLARRRNDAAHARPLYDFVDASEAIEFIMSAGRRLPPLWELGFPPQ